MTGAQITALVVALYVVVAAGVLGALLERERLLNPDGERGWKWVGSLALAVWFWPILGLLWADSRPVPAQPPQARDERLQPDGPWLLAPPKDWEGDWEVGPGRLLYTGPVPPPQPTPEPPKWEEPLTPWLKRYDFVNQPLKVFPQWQYVNQPRAVQNPRKLEHVTSSLGGVVLIVDRGISVMLIDSPVHGRVWIGVNCQCTWGSLGSQLWVCPREDHRQWVGEDAVFHVPKTRDLASRSLRPGDKVYVSELGRQVMLDERGYRFLDVERCGCVWDRHGAPVVVCRVHRTDVDPQGEPDDEDEVEGS